MRPRRRWPRRLSGIDAIDGLYGGLAAAYLAPLWIVGSVPTTDGGSHVYNAWVLLRLATGTASPLIRSVFQIDPRPLPNWLTHAALALLLVPFDPRTAEKLLVSCYVLLFLVAVRRLAGAVAPERRALAFLAFPFVYSWPVQMGFYNFGIGMALGLLAIAVWWRGREAATLAFALRVNLVLFLAYFAHPVPHAVALAVIGTLWLTGLPHRPFRRHLLHLPLLLPQVVLPLWFARGAGAPLPRRMPLAAFARYFVRLEGLVAFGPEQLRLAAAVAAAFFAVAGFAVLSALARRGPQQRPLRPREEDGFLLAALLVAALCFAVPEGAAESGIFLPWRLTLFPWLLALPWIPLRGRAARGLVALGFAALGLADLAVIARAYRALDAARAPLFRVLVRATPGARLLPLIFDQSSLGTRLAVYSHASGYQAAEKGMVDWSDYEAGLSYFPVRFRPEIERPDLYTMSVAPETLPLAFWSGGTVDEVLTWKLEPSPSARRLARRYDLIAEAGPARLYRARR